MWDACGMAGGTREEVFNAGAYNATPFAKQGDLGSAVLAPRPSGTVWTRGARARARVQLTAAHGGGYRFRLCPAGAPLTEACFQAHELAFATPATHWVRFADSARDFEIPAVVVAHGGGAGWMRHPQPYVTDLACDYVVQPPDHCGWDCPGCGAPTYAADGACPCVCYDEYPELSNRSYGADPAWTPALLPDVPEDSYAIEDTLVVPDDIPPGDYVLGWRWDCEMTSQVWSSCADITIV